MIEFLSDPHVWASFVALSAMEIVLGIDNVVFISVMVSRMPPEQRLMARRVGLSLALVFRIAMLAGIAWFIHLTTPIFSIGADPPPSAALNDAPRTVRIFFASASGA